MRSADENEQSLGDNTRANEPPPIRQLSAPELKALIESGTPFELALLMSARGPQRQWQDIPLLIDFAAPTSLLREQDRISTLPIVGNDPPGTFVLFQNGLRVSLPTDQIVFADDTGGHARVGFGGMRFVGSEEGRLVFVRIRELFPEDQLSPARGHMMRLDPQWVATISVDGRPVWPGGSPSR